MSQESDIVVMDDGRSKISDLWKKEDYWAIWLGFAILIAGYFLFAAQVPESYTKTIAEAEKHAQSVSGAPFKTVEYFEAEDKKAKLRARDNVAGKTLANFLKQPGGWTSNPVEAFIYSDESAAAANEAGKAKADAAKSKATESLAAAKTAQAAAAGAAFKDETLNAAADKQIETWRGDVRNASKAADKTKHKGFNILPTLLQVLVAGMLFFGVGLVFMGHRISQFAVAFIPVFIVCVLAFVMGSQSTMKLYGIGSEAWAIVIGMLIANTVGTPKFVKPALQVEFYIKTGLVLLGAEVLLDKIIAIGIPGIFVAWVVTPIVLICTFIFGQKVLKMPSKTLNIVISADMSVCGTSAAIATAAACRAKKEELTLSIGLSLVFTAIMMVAMPAVIKAIGMPEILGGAWMGGTIDATGAVAAAGAFLGEKALYVAATIKMIQNVLIGVTAFGVAVYWCAKVDCVEGRKVHVREIWDRFPKFVIGFLGASIAASILSSNLGTDLSNAMVNEGLVRGIASPMRNWCFGLAFTAIGLATNFRELAQYFKGGKPLILYVVGQSFNLVLTLVMAYIMFYLVFPEITAKI